MNHEEFSNFNLEQELADILYDIQTVKILNEYVYSQIDGTQEILALKAAKVSYLLSGIIDSSIARIRQCNEYYLLRYSSKQ